MKSRKWLVTVIVLFLLLVVGIQLAWKYLSVNERLRNLLLSEIRPNVQGEITIGKLEVKLGTIHLKNIAFAWEKQPYVVKIKDLRLGLNFFNLFKYNFNPLRFVSDVVLDHPEIILKSTAFSEKKPRKPTSSSSDSLTQALIQKKYRQRLIDFKFVGRIVLDKGAVGIQDTSGQTHFIVNQLDGWVNTEDLSRAIVRMNGKFLSSKKYNLGVNGLINLRRGILDSIRLNLYSDNLAEAFPNLPKEKWQILSGTLLGRLTLRENLNNTGNPLDLSGLVRLENLNVDFFSNKIPVRELTCSFLVDHWNVQIQDATQKVFGTPVALSGQVENLLDPQFQFTLNSQDFVLQRILSRIFPNKILPARGRAKLSLQVSGRPGAPCVTGRLEGRNLHYGGIPARRISARFGFERGVLSFQKISARLAKLAVKGSGQLRLKKPLKGAFHYKAFGDAFPLLQSAPLRGVKFVGLSLSGTTKIDSGKIANQFTYRSRWAGAQMDTLDFSGSSTFAHGLLKINVNQTGAPFQGQVLLQLGQPAPHISAELLHFGGSLWKVLPVPFQQTLRGRIGVSLRMEGGSNDLNYTLVAERKSGEALIPNLFQVDGTLKRKKRAFLSLNGAIRYFPLSGETVPGSIHLQVSPQAIVLQEYRLGDYYGMTGRINRSTGALNGQIQVKNAALAYVFDGLLLQPVLNVQGVVNGLVVLRGTLAEPAIVGQFNLEKGVFSGYGYYNGLVSLEYRAKKLHVNQLVLNRERDQILALSGVADLSSQALNFQAHGQNVDVDFLSQLLGNRIRFLSGRCSFDLSILDRWRSPDFRGHMEFENGQLFFVNYDHLLLELGKSRATKKQATSVPGIWVQKMNLVRNGKFSVHARAFFPFSLNHEMDIRLNGTGDFLALLLENVAFFKKTSSDSRFSFSIGGTYSAPIYTGGTVDFKSGMLEFQDVLPKATQLHGRVRLEPDAQFVHILGISGQMAGQPIEIKSFGKDLKCSRHLAPLIIHTWGLNFGVIGVRTGKKGIPVHIPGMMQPGDQIWVQATGKGDEEYLYLAGPSSSPVLRGVAMVHDGNISYPFEESKKQEKNAKPDFVTDVLNRMVWDLTVIPGRNVHYVKTIAGLIDKVWVNATIDSPEDGLHFSGRLIDKSFRIVGKLESTRGSVEYLDLNFSIERFGIEFDRSDILPVVYGRARTVLTDSTGFPYNIYATLYTIDPQTKVERERGRWGQIHFRLSTDNPNIGNSEAQILGALGYSVQNMRGKATDIIGISADHLLIKPLFRPIERHAEKFFKLDIVTIRSQFARNMLEINRYNRQIDPRYLIFRSTQVTLGKYLKNNLFLLYSVELEAGLDPRYQESGLGFKNYLNLEYRMKPNLLFELQYNYNNLLRKQKSDFRVQIRHSFMF